MRVRHRIIIAATCPVNGDPDRYVCDVFVTDRVLYCEDVRDTVEALTREPVTQEALSQMLADRLGAVVRTRGTHCRGRVETVVVCRPRPEQEGRP